MMMMTNWKKVPSQIITAATSLELETNIPTSSDASVKLAMTDAQNGILTLNQSWLEVQMK